MLYIYIIYIYIYIIYLSIYLYLCDVCVCVCVWCVCVRVRVCSGHDTDHRVVGRQMLGPDLLVVLLGVAHLVKLRLKRNNKNQRHGVSDALQREGNDCH